MEEESIYLKYSVLNPFRGIGFKEYHKLINKVHYYYVPSIFRKDESVNSYVSIYKLKDILKSDITYQIYYDLVVLGIDSIKKRPKCVHCGGEAKFSFIWEKCPQGYREYCKNKECRYKTTSNKTSAKLKGRPLSEINKRNLSKAKKGKKLTEEQRLKRPRGYHFTLTDEQRRKISESKKGKIKSRSYYNSGIFESKKFSTSFSYLSSYERDFLQFCENSKQIISIEVPDPIRYYYAGGFHSYYPDFLITISSGQKFLVEIKAKNLINTEKVIAKRIAGIKWCKKNNVKYITLTEEDLYIKRKITDPKNHKRVKKYLNFYDYL